MTWAKLDDMFWAHPKTYLVGLDSLGLHMLAMSYCAHYLTNGEVSHDWVGTRVPRGDKRGVVAALVRAKLWAEVPGGYLLNDYLDYNPSKAEVEAQRDKWREKKRKQGENGASSRWASPRSSPGEPAGDTQEPPPVESHGPVPVPMSSSNSEEDKGSPDADRIFLHWQGLLASPQARFTDGRRQKVRARLKHYSVDRVLRAIDGCAASDFHVQNNYVDLKRICGSDEQLERFESLPLKAEGVRGKDGTKVIGAGLLSTRDTCARCPEPITSLQANNQSGMCDPCYEAHVEKLTGQESA